MSTFPRSSVARGGARRSLIFRVKGNQPPSNPRHGRTRLDGDKFRAGDAVPQSGIYEVLHHSNHRPTHEVVMLARDIFPSCDTCRAQVRFHLIRTAPYIFQDEDFEQE